MMNGEIDSIAYLQQQVIKFRDARDWKQFHAPKNLAIGLAVEAGELLDEYKYTDQPRVPENVSKEVGDVLYSLLLFCHATYIDPGRALMDKLAENELKYPVHRSYGSARKYTDYEEG